MTIDQDLFGFRQARSLLERLQEGQPLRREVQAQAPLVLAAGVSFLLVSIGCAAATAIFFAELNAWLALPALIFAPVVLMASLLVQAMVFLFWLENQAIAAALHRKGIAARRVLPRVPWALATLALFVPLALLAVLWPPAAILLALLGACVPAFYVLKRRLAA